MSNLIKKAEEKRKKVLEDFKIQRIIRLLEKKNRLKKQIILTDKEIKEVEKLDEIPEGCSY